MSKPILVFRNEAEISNTVSGFESHRPKFQAVVDLFTDLHIGEISSKEEMETAITRPDEFIKMKLEQRLKEQPVQISGIPLKLNRVMDLLDPGEAGQFVAAAKAVQFVSHLFARVGSIQAGEVVLDKSLVAQYTEQCSVYAASEKQKTVLQALQTIIAGVDMLRSSGAPVDVKLTRLSDIMHDNPGKGFILNHQYFQRIAGK